VKPTNARPKVEDLSDLQWARLERGLWSRLDAEDASPPAEQGSRYAAPPRSRGRRALAVAGGLALVAALVLVFWARRPGELGAPTPARVVTRESATTLSFAEAAIEVQARSALLLNGSAQSGATVVLERGGAGFKVAPRVTPFVVVAGDVSVRVVGTQFSVTRQGERVAVAVAEGKVDVRYRGELHQLLRGGRWATPPEVQEEILLEDAGADASAATDATERDDGSAAPADSDAAPSRRPRRTRAGETAPVAPATAPPVAPMAPDEGTRTEDLRRAGDEFAAAARLETAQPQEALHRYLVLAQRGDRWGATALFAAARLAFDIGEPDRGRSLATAYLRRFPRGLNAVDAAALLEGRR
jgi:FecR protein